MTEQHSRGPTPLEKLRAYAKTLNRRARLEDSFNDVLVDLCADAGWRYGAIWSCDWEKRIVQMRCALHLSEPESANMRLPVGEEDRSGLAGRTAYRKDTIAFGTAEEATARGFPSTPYGKIGQGRDIRSFISCPMLSGKRVVGVLQVLDEHPRSIRGAEIRLLEALAGILGDSLVVAERNLEEDLASSLRDCIRVAENEAWLKEPEATNVSYPSYEQLCKKACVSIAKTLSARHCFLIRAGRTGVDDNVIHVTGDEGMRGAAARLASEVATTKRTVRHYAMSDGMEHSDMPNRPSACIEVLPDEVGRAGLSAMGVPLISTSGKFFGAIALVCRESSPPFFSQVEEASIAAILPELISTIEHWHFLSAVSRLQYRFKVIDINQGLEASLQNVLSQAAEAVDAKWVYVMEYGSDEHGALLRPLTSIGRDVAQLPQLRLEAPGGQGEPEGINAIAFRRKAPYLCIDTSKDRSYKHYVYGEEAGAELAVPLVAGEGDGKSRVIGTLCAATEHAGGVESRDALLLSLVSGYVAYFLQNARGLEQIQSYESRLRENKALDMAGGRALTVSHSAWRWVNADVARVQSRLELSISADERDFLNALLASFEKRLPSLAAVRSVLSVARTPRRNSVRIKIFLNAAIARVIDRLVERKMKIVKRFPSEDPTVYVDESLLELAFENLIRNSCEYSYPGTPINIECEIDQSANAVLIQIRDEGPGFPAEMLAKQGEEPLSDRSRRGLGLGVWLSGYLIRANGGSIELTNEAKGRKGACVSVILPIKAERE